MADYTIPWGRVGVHEISLAPDTELVVEFDYDCPWVEVSTLDANAPVYFSVNGYPAAVGGGNCYQLFPGPNGMQVATRSSRQGSATKKTQVRLISSASASISVVRT